MSPSALKICQPARFIFAPELLRSSSHSSLADAPPIQAISFTRTWWCGSASAVKTQSSTASGGACLAARGGVTEGFFVFAGEASAAGESADRANGEEGEPAAAE